jgi:hypothetical protein
MVIAYCKIKCTDTKWHGNKNMCTFCTDRQTVASNLSRCKVIAYWIFHFTDTNWYVDKKYYTGLYDIQIVDSNVTGRMVIAYCKI